MGANGLLTVLALLVAGYSLLSDIKRLDFKLRISKFNYLIAVGLVASILIVIYSPVILSFDVIEPIGWYWGFDEETMSFSCLTALVLLFSWKAAGKKLPSSNIEESVDNSRQGKKLSLNIIINHPLRWHYI